MIDHINKMLATIDRIGKLQDETKASLDRREQHLREYERRLNAKAARLSVIHPQLIGPQSGIA